MQDIRWYGLYARNQVGTYLPKVNMIGGGAEEIMKDLIS